MENGIEEILKEHEALCSRVFHILNTGNPQTKDIELIIPKVKELFGMLEAINTKQITAQQYNGLLNVMSEWNAIFSYFNIKMVPCRLRPFLWNSPKVAVKRIPRQCIEGIVVSTKMQKTAVIEVERTKKHPKYGKTVQYTKKYKIHDPLEECSVGDRVLAHETRHFSKTKYFRFYRKLY